MATSTQLLACVLLLSAVCAQGANTEGERQERQSPAQLVAAAVTDGPWAPAGVSLAGDSRCRCWLCGGSHTQRSDPGSSPHHSSPAPWLAISLHARTPRCLHTPPPNHPPPLPTGRALKTLITKVAAVQPAAVQIVSVPVVSKSISLGAGGLTLSKGGQAAAATSVQQAAEPQPQAQAQTQQPQAQQPQPRQQAPAAAAAPAAAPATAGVSAPAGLPIPRPVPGNSDLGQALQCQSAFNAAGGRPGVENQLGNVCREGNAAFNELGCCQQV